MAVVVQDHVFNPDGSQERELMLNNEKFSDTQFLVNNTQFHVSSHMVCVHSTVLDDVIEDHFKNCGDREIRIREIKHNDSFYVMLRYIYGLSINFTQTAKAVLCEVLCLSERYNLPILTKEIKRYLSQLQDFQIDSVVVLLNAAEKFSLEPLLGKLTDIVFKNANELVKQDSFVDLQYDVILELIKSDCFSAQEVYILRGVLNWHSNNMSKSSSSENKLHEHEEHIGSVERVRSVDFECDDPCVQEKAGCCDSNDPDNTPGEIVKTFSENILKILLSHIRISKISALEMINLLNTEPYIKYKEFFDSEKNFSSKTKARIGVVEPLLYNNNE